MRISEKFGELKRRGEKALILYITCGDPSAEETIKIARRIIDAGCDILELGLPFSDPLADGPTIEAASQRAIAAGMTTDLYFRTCAKIAGVPKVCMTYYNLIYQYGLERFAKACHNSGITGLIVPDLPPEESGPLKKACDENGVDLVFIVSPQTSEERLAIIKKAISSGKSRITECYGGFIYLQSVLGITGARDDLKLRLAASIRELKKFGLPVAVGFGISRPDQIRESIQQGADGVIIGSALIERINEGKDIASFVRSLKEATI